MPTRQVTRMLPLLLIAPLGCFLAPYLYGAGVLPQGIWMTAALASKFLLPCGIAILFLAVGARLIVRLSLVVGALLVQSLLLNGAIPSGATSKTVGLAHALRLQLSSDQLRTCAGELIDDFREGTLRTSETEYVGSYPVYWPAVEIDDSQLPGDLRGRFDRVLIQTDPETGEHRVTFALDESTGILCDHRDSVRENRVRSMAKGVHAYRYHRM